MQVQLKGLMLPSPACLPAAAACAHTRRRGADRNRMYVPSAEERAADQAEASKAAVVALAVVLGPVVVMAALLAGARLYLL